MKSTKQQLIQRSVGLYWLFSVYNEFQEIRIGMQMEHNCLVYCTGHFWEKWACELLKW